MRDQDRKREGMRRMRDIARAMMAEGLTDSGDVVEDVAAWEITDRAARYADVLQAFDAPGDVAPDDDRTPRRWAIAHESDGRTEVLTFDTLTDATDYLGDQVLEGWDPVGIFDLDTARAYGPHVSTPIVTASEDAASAPAVLGFTACDSDDIEEEARGPYGRCDTCGAPCDARGCMVDRGHEASRP
jgi:hypothetical protein